MEYAKLSNKFQFFCGCDMHSKSTYFKVLDKSGHVLAKKNLPNNFDRFKKFIEPFKETVVVGAESTYNYYWLFDGCQKENIPFVLGHALYIRAIAGNKKKNDALDAETLANLMRTDFLPKAYPYPNDMRSVRDLLRRRHRLMRLRSEAYTHIQLISHQNEMQDVNSAAAKNKALRNEMISRIDEPYIAENLKIDAFIIDTMDPKISEIEHRIKSRTKLQNSKRFLILQTIPGIGEMTALIIIYETHDISRFPNAGKYASYCRTVKCERTSNGKKKKNVNQKIGNPYLKWAFGQILHNARMAEKEIDRLYLKLERKKGKKIARAIMAHKFTNAAYFMMKNEQVFDLNKFLNRK